MKHIFTVEIQTKVPKNKILIELEILLNEFIERDEDLKIHAKKTKPKSVKNKNR